MVFRSTKGYGSLSFYIQHDAVHLLHHHRSMSLTAPIRTSKPVLTHLRGQKMCTARMRYYRIIGFLQLSFRISHPGHRYTFVNSGPTSRASPTHFALKHFNATGSLRGGGPDGLRVRAFHDPSTPIFVGVEHGVTLEKVIPACTRATAGSMVPLFMCEIKPTGHHSIMHPVTGVLMSCSSY